MRSRDVWNVKRRENPERLGRQGRLGNGPFRLRQGGILIGEAHAPGFVLKSQERFLQLFDRVKKAMVRGSEVVVVIE